MNIYYDPEKFGLEIIGEIDRADSYEFDKLVVFKKGKDILFATDSGCSCPTPFESVGVNDLIGYSDAELDKWIKGCDYRTPNPVEVLDLKRKIRELRGKRK